MKLASDSDGAEAKEETNWMPLIVFIQSKGNMRREEILAAPLFLINSVHEELVKIAASDLAGSLNASMLGMLGGGTAQPAQQKNDPRMGETLKFGSRDEYFEFMNKHR